jgi:DNA-binding response OmpR family regulator
MNNQRALVVEDSRTIACLVKHFLQLEGFEVLLAADGLIGLETARRERPSVIVTDLNMPGMDGLDMVRALRADARTHDIAICMLTSDERAETERECRAVGADDYILKPMEPRCLAARVRVAMERAESAIHG